MEKPAKTQLSIHPILKQRWSPRSFTDKTVSTEILQRIFEAARWAPSSFNDQPWRFLVGQKGDGTYNKIVETLMEFNQKWAVAAPVLVLAIGKKISDKTGKESRVFSYDLGQSAAHITFQVQNEGLFMHQMGGFDPAKAKELFHIPDDHQAMVAFAIGYKGEPELLSDDFAKMEKSERERKPLSHIVFTESFGKAPDWV